MKWVLRLLSILASTAATVLLIFVSFWVATWPYTVLLLAVLLSIRYITDPNASPPLRLPIGFTLLFNLFYLVVHLPFHPAINPAYTKNLYDINQACFAYASGHEGKYPDGKSSNEALRQLFISGLVDDEHMFDLGQINKVTTDGNIGTQENGFLQALAPGECAYSYIRGHVTGKTLVSATLLFTHIVTDDGRMLALSVRQEGEGKLSVTTEGTDTTDQNGKQWDSLSEAYLKEKYGIEPQDILRPEGPPRDLTAIARERKMKIHLTEMAILAAIWLPFLLIYALKIRRKAVPTPGMPAPEA